MYNSNSSAAKKAGLAITSSASTSLLVTPQTEATSAAKLSHHTSLGQFRNQDQDILSRQFKTRAELLDTAFDAKLLKFHRRHAEMEKLIATFD